MTFKPGAMPRESTSLTKHSMPPMKPPAALGKTSLEPAMPAMPAAPVMPKMPAMAGQSARSGNGKRVSQSVLKANGM